MVGKPSPSWSIEAFTTTGLCLEFNLSFSVLNRSTPDKPGVPLTTKEITFFC